ncbi:hypothetical protein AWN68_10245 [Roseivirga echinicomitans]|uniref:Uncharacterized protein n=1 Tax=Roseivirga echinicomitans TaxID=296218 RepID=A0A150X396_9BACT|nr:hypothetical protein AWN68_10245 [Roseivirga echinicomitans]
MIFRILLGKYWNQKNVTKRKIIFCLDHQSLVEKGTDTAEESGAKFKIGSYSCVSQLLATKHRNS